jgi:tRNA 5-methylaminomethyl-2-thiouridine biosynthesis bifunctional protein
VKTSPVQPATLVFNADGVPFNPQYGDVYHAHAGALDQARHVFLGGNQLPTRWRGRSHFSILELGFGLGNNFLATWDAWRRDSAHSERLHYVAIEKHPLVAADLARVHAASPLRELADALVAQWPSATPNLHRLTFDGGRVQLTLGWFDVADVLPELVARIDTFYLDGFAPARNPQMWEGRVFKALGRLAADGATAATWTAARTVRDGLTQAGFVVEHAAGFDAKRDMTVARFAPSFVPRTAPARQAAAAPQHVAVIGGGLAGTATAWALAEQGIACTVFDRHARPASAASGNAAGLFHGVVTGDDASHARFNRAAALQAARIVDDAVRTHAVAGAVSGLLRLVTAMPADASLAGMRDTLAALGLSADHVRAVDAPEASRLAGVALAHPAWFYPGGGWVDPAALCASLLQQAGAAVRWRGGVEVGALRRVGEQWELLNPQGLMLDAVDAVVLADNADPRRWIGGPAWPLQRVRGQMTSLPAAVLPAAQVRMPVAGAGYVLPPIDGRIWCGASNAADDDDGTLRAAEQEANVEQLSALLGRPLDVPVQALGGRVGWRSVTADRLPLVGALPDAAAIATASRLDQPRFVPRLPGLHTVNGLGSRGIAWAPLAARTVAALLAGAPCPLEASLLDAVDAARFVSRNARRAT